MKRDPEFPRSGGPFQRFDPDKISRVMTGDRWKAKAELVIERKTGKVRQAGAVSAEGKFVQQFKTLCERDLFAFLDGVMNYWFLEPSLHMPVCAWLTRIPAYRKMLLMPRNHGKSTIVGRGIPLHALIQPAGGNIYYPNQPGSHLRLVLTGETEERAKEHLRVIKAALEGNALLRALWPHVCWDNPRRQAPTWSDTVIIVPRDTPYPEPTIRGIGVGGAITGSHPNMLIKDDLTTEKAANEPPTMAKAIEWHLDSRALLANPDKDLEFITGTRWAAYDLPGYIQENDATVEVNKEWRRVVDDGKVIYPFKYGYEGAVEQLQKEHGVKFQFLFMNEATGGDATDFMLSDLREYEMRGGSVYFQENEQDIGLDRAVNAPPPKDEDPPRGSDFYQALNLMNMDYLRNTRSL